MASKEELRPTADRYVSERGFSIVSYLGGGEDGHVWESDQITAVKCFERERNYLRELRCYQRLNDRKVHSINGFELPGLVDYSNALMVVEMGIVQPPCILDFGKAYIDQPPDFSAEVMEDHKAHQQEIWGDRLPQVESIVWQLRMCGIYYLDAKPDNIMFER